MLRDLMRKIEELERNHEVQAETSYHPFSPPTIQGPNDNLSPQKQSDSTWLPCHYFDYVAGTSTGG